MGVKQLQHNDTIAGAGAAAVGPGVGFPQTQILKDTMDIPKKTGFFEAAYYNAN